MQSWNPLYFYLLFAGYGMAGLAYLSLLFNPKSNAAEVGRGVLFFTWLFHTAVVALRMTADHALMHFWYAPIANAFEQALCWSWSMAGIYLIAEFRTSVTALGVLVVPLIAALVGWAALGMDQTLEPPPPALQSYWINIHVPMHLVAYSAFTIAFALSIFYFVKRGEENRGKTMPTPTPAGGRVAVAEKQAAASTGFLALIPDARELDKMIYRTVVIGFGFLTALIMLGAVWAEVSWGKYWGWDPKETSALVTWLIYAAYLHARFSWGAKRRDAMVGLCIAGFAAMLFTYFVGYVLPGLHSYLKG